MIDTPHLIKVTFAWISVIYIICYAGVAIYPPIRDLFVRYALHADVVFKSDFLNLGYFISGLIIWNIAVISSAWLFAFLFNKINE